MLKYLAALVVIFGLAFVVARQDQRAANQAAHKAAELHKAAVAANSNEQHPQENIENATGNGPRWYVLYLYDLFRWPNGTTTWAIILTLMAIAEQTSETRRSVLISLGPQLIIRGIAVTDEGSDGWQVECQIVNIGGSKAIIIESNITIAELGITAEDRLPVFPPYSADRKWLKKKAKFAAGEHFREKVALGLSNSALLLAFLNAARRETVNVIDTLYCFGFIQYRDRLCVQRRTAFCLKYNSVIERFERTEGKRAENYDYAD